MNVLIIEDDEVLAANLSKELQKKGHKTIICHSVKKFISDGLEYKADIIILDLLLGKERGEDIVKSIKKSSVKVPILILSAVSHVKNKVELLKMGVDDYMTKPFDFDELLARIEVLHKRYLNLYLTNKEVYGDFVFYWKQNKMSYKGKEIFLTQKEKNLLELLVRNHDRVVSNKEILKAVWNMESLYHSNILQSLIRYLRKKLEKNTQKQLIHNIHGVGYIISFN